MRTYRYSMAAVAVLLMTQQSSAIEMTDYKLAESFFDQAYVGLTFDLKDGNQDKTSYNGTFTGDYNARKNTIPYAWDITVGGNANFTQGPNTGDPSDENYLLNTSGNFDNYLDDYDKVFIYGSGQAAYRKVPGAAEADDPFFKVGAGVGYGRIYEATPLAKTLRIVEDLQEYKVIGEVDDETLLKIAEIIDLEEEYESKYGFREYKRFWYEDIEKVLKEAGTLKHDSLGAIGIIRMDEILFIERVSPRFHGWSIRTGFGQILSNFDGESNDPTWDVVFEYGLPIGYKSQFYDKAQYSTILADETGHLFSNNMTYTYEIGDRVDWENGWVYTYTKATDTIIPDVQTNNLSSTFIYYLANRLNFSTTLGFVNVEDDIENGNEEWETRLNVGLSYRLK